MNTIMGKLLVTAALACAVTWASAAEKTKVLIVTGIDYPAHKWRETAPLLRDIIEGDKRMEVKIVEVPEVLDSAALDKFDVVVLHFQNWQVPGPGARARENLMRFVKRGGGLVSVHFACGAWYGEWPEFEQLIGRVWYGPDGGPQHDRRGPFKVEVVDREHPVTKGLADFETDDELYTCLKGSAPIHLLAQSKSQVDGQYHPMAFVREFGRGRVFLTTLGHDVKALAPAPVQALIQRGTAWAAGLEPAGD